MPLDSQQIISQYIRKSYLIVEIRLIYIQAQITRHMIGNMGPTKVNSKSCEGNSETCKLCNGLPIGREFQQLSFM